MKILVLHRIPYHKIKYHLGIDHDRHDVTYVGTRTALDNLPNSLRRTAIERPGIGPVFAEVIASVRAQGLQFDRVISLSEYELLDAARVRMALGVAGPGVEDVLKVRDKLVMKRLVSARGIRVPQAATLGALLADGTVSWSGATVLKPIDGASSEDVRVFPSPDAVRAACLRRHTGITGLDDEAASDVVPRFEVEEFIPGPILHFDGLVLDGQVRIVRGSRYVGDCLSYAQGMPLGSVQFDIGAADEAWVKAVIDGVGIAQGSFHLEAIEDVDNRSGEKVFLEVANRVGGADVVDTFEMATGVHLPSAELRILTGETVAFNAQPKSDLYYGWFVFPGHHLPEGGCQLTEHQAFAMHPFVLRCNQLSDGARLPRHITYQAVEVPFAGVIAGASSQELTQWLRRMFDVISVSSAPSTFETTA